MTTNPTEKLTTGRRDFLALMGLGVAGSALANTEALADAGITGQQGFPRLGQAHAEAQAKFAQCLENLAAALRRGDVACIDILTESRIDFNAAEWLAHDVRMRFEIVKDMA